MAAKTVKRFAITWMAGAATGGIIVAVASNPMLRGKFLEMRRRCMERCQGRMKAMQGDHSEVDLHRAA
ncbi:MAG: hypothetical protein IIC85_12460 [Chloroflexi bacterium]|nr:hypothetical protein [Chloroflexota bacterium]